MDSANHALASYLARCGSPELHVVTHALDPEVARAGNVRLHRVPRPLGVHRLGMPLLRAAAHEVRRRVGGAARAIANGGNADLRDVAWMHYVHAAHEPQAFGVRNRLATAWSHRRYVEAERRTLATARLIVCNSRRTAADVAAVDPAAGCRTRVVYYGVDASAYRAVTPAERMAARASLGLSPDRRVALFAGALGDRRKNFDTLVGVWQRLCRRRAWDVDLVVAGAGAELSAWRARAARVCGAGRIRFLGYRSDVPTLLAASDVLVHPSRYEPYGLIVHEAVCRGVPAIVSAAAGIAERYPAGLDGLLLRDPESEDELTARLLAWRTDGSLAAAIGALGSHLRARPWDDMAAEIVAAIASTP